MNRAGQPVTELPGPVSGHTLTQRLAANAAVGVAHGPAGRQPPPGQAGGPT